jgi:Carboxypeptidase regulatory-like domain
LNYGKRRGVQRICDTLLFAMKKHWTPVCVFDAIRVQTIGWVFVAIVLATLVLNVSITYGQTASTSALTGTVIDSTGAVLPEVGGTLRDQRTNAAQSVRSRETGALTFSALRPGTYQLQGIKAGYASSRWTDITISVAETVRVQPQLLLPTLAQRVEVRLDPLVVQTDSMTLGRVVNETAVSNLPLVRRNFTQIVGLSPGVT